MTGSEEDRTDMVRRMSTARRMTIIETHEIEAAKQKRLHCCPFYIPKRLIMVLLCFFGMFVIHAMRVNVAVAVVTLMDEQSHAKVGTPKAVSNILVTRNLNWDARMIGLLHSVFYVGFLLTQIPGGFLVTKIPSHRIFGASILLSCALNLLVPLAIADVGYVFTCVVRFTQGLSEGLVFPACYDILRLWIVRSDVSTMSGMVITGVYAGAIFGFPISGFLTHYVGWQHVFYVNGALGIVWFLFWIYLAFEKPEHHPYISQTELKFILSSQADLPGDDDDDDFVPWSDIFTSVPVLALCVCHFARSWMFFLLLTNEPAYINVFGYSIATNGILSSIPHIAMVIVSAFSGHVADCLIRKEKLTVTQVRKIFTCVGFGMEALSCCTLTFVNQGDIAMIVLTIGVGLSGMTTSGWQINHLDIAPRHAGILIGITTAVGTLGGIVSPIVVGIITVDQHLNSWQMSWLLTGCILSMGVLFYAIFASGERQVWASPAAKRASQASILDGREEREESNTQNDQSEDTLKKDQSENGLSTDRSENRPLKNNSDTSKTYGSNNSDTSDNVKDR